MLNTIVYLVWCGEQFLITTYVQQNDNQFRPIKNDTNICSCLSNTHVSWDGKGFVEPQKYILSQQSMLNTMVYLVWCGDDCLIMTYVEITNICQFRPITVEPLNKGQVGSMTLVRCREVVPFSEVVLFSSTQKSFDSIIKRVWLPVCPLFGVIVYLRHF